MTQIMMNESPARAFPFKIFVGGRRRLSGTDDIFQHGNLERQVAAKEAVLCLTEAERDELTRTLKGNNTVPVRLTNRPQCATCKRVFLTEHLLGLHISEAHDSFFAAQSARGHKVFRCLVECCSKSFTSSNGRKQHLIVTHHFPASFNFDILHKQGSSQRKQQGRRQEGERKPGAAALSSGSSGRARRRRGSGRKPPPLGAVEAAGEVPEAPIDEMEVDQLSGVVASVSLGVGDRRNAGQEGPPGMTS